MIWMFIASIFGRLTAPREIAPLNQMDALKLPSMVRISPAGFLICCLHCYLRSNWNAILHLIVVRSEWCLVNWYEQQVIIAQVSASHCCKVDESCDPTNTVLTHVLQYLEAMSLVFMLNWMNECAKFRTPFATSTWWPVWTFNFLVQFAFINSPFLGCHVLVCIFKSAVSCIFSINWHFV